MRVAVVGAGGVGGYFGGRLARSGLEVSFIVRGATLEAMRRDGLSIESPLGNARLPHVDATDDPSRVGPVDLVLLGVKAWQVEQVARQIGPLIGEGTAILPLQNGIEAEGQLAAVYGAEHVLGGMCRIVAFVEAPGRIRHAAVDPFISFGELDNRRSDRVESLLQAFHGAGIGAAIPPDIHVSLWMKYLFIAPVSGVGAITRAPAGVTRALPETRELLVAGMREVCALAQARGIALPDDAIDSTLRFLDGMSPEATSSMQRDIIAGRPSELEAIVGAAVRLGRELGVETPVQCYLYAGLLPLERQARGEPD